MKRRPMLVTALLMGFLLSACSLRSANTVNAGSNILTASPLIGSWTGKSDIKGSDLDKFANSIAGGPLTGPSSMTLNADGTGFLKVADQPERPISWKAEGDKVILQGRSIGAAHGQDTSQTERADADGPWVGTLGVDRKSMVIDMGKVKVTLNHPSGG